MEWFLPEAMCLYEGDFGNGFFASQALLDGDFYCRTGDEIGLIYRDDSDGNYDYSMPCAVYDDGDSTVNVLTDLETSTTWSFVRRWVSVGGTISPVSDDNYATTSGAGNWYPAPNVPHDLTATAINNTVIQLNWKYDPTGEQNSPVTFSVYNNTVDPNTALGPINYKEGQTKYSYETSSLTHGVNYEFVVRATYALFPAVYTSDATDTVNATADDTGPAAISDFDIEVVNP